MLGKHFQFYIYINFKCPLVRLLCKVNVKETVYVSGLNRMTGIECVNHLL